MKNENFLNLKFEYDSLDRFINGIALVMRNDEYWLINKEGVEITKQGYYHVYTEKIDPDLKNDFIRVETIKEYNATSDYDYSNVVRYVSKCNQGLVDKSGFEIIPPENENIHFRVQVKFILITEYFLNNNLKYTIIDFNGQKMIKSSHFIYVSNFYKDRAIALIKDTYEAFIVDNNFKKIKSLGIKTEKEIGPQHIYDQDEQVHFYAPEYEMFINDLLPLKSNNKWGAVNIYGEVVCEYKFDYLLPLKNDLIISGFKKDDKMKYSLLNKDFKEIIPYKYDIIRPFCESIAVVRLDNKWGVIDERGNEIINPEFHLIEDCKNGFLITSYGDYENEKKYWGVYGLFDTKGKKLCPTIYQSIEICNSQFALCKHGSKIIFIEKSGSINFSLSNRYDDVLEYNNGFYLVRDNEAHFVIDELGKEFVEDRLDYLP